MSLKANLQKLYPADYQKIYQQIKILIADFKKDHPDIAKQKKSLFTEKDIILSCYPDHIREPNTPSLRSLAKFLRTYTPFINHIHILPFYPSSGDEGFAVVDYLKVEKKFGTWREIRRLSKNFNLMFDLVLNHCSDQNSWFQKFLAQNKNYQNFFIAFSQVPNTAFVFRPRTDPLLKTYLTKKGKKYVWSTFPLSQVDLNFSNPQVFLHFLNIALVYVSYGAKILRLDAVAYLWKKLGTSCFDLPQAHFLVKIFRSVLEQAAPNTKLVAEVVAEPQANARWWGDGDEAHLVYNFILEPLLALTVIEQDSKLVTYWLNKLTYPYRDSTYLNLTISHDGIHTVPAQNIIPASIMQKLAKHIKKQGGQVLYRSSGGKKVPYEFNATYLSAIGDVRAFLATQTIQLALRGVPLIYFNNLIGAKNYLAGFRQTGHSRSLNRQRFWLNDLVKKLNGSGDQAKIFSAFSYLIKTRMAEPLFSPQAEQKLVDFGPGLLAIRREKGKRRLLSLTNITNKQIKVQAQSIYHILGRRKIKDLIGASSLVLDRSSFLTLAPYQSMWLK